MRYGAVQSVWPENDHTTTFDVSFFIVATISHQMVCSVFMKRKQSEHRVDAKNGCVHIIHFNSNVANDDVVYGECAKVITIHKDDKCPFHMMTLCLHTKRCAWKLELWCLHFAICILHLYPSGMQTYLLLCVAWSCVAGCSLRCTLCKCLTLMVSCTRSLCTAPHHIALWQTCLHLSTLPVWS